VHRHPVSAWSSHGAYLGLEEIPWLTKRMVMDLLPATPDGELTAYAVMMAREEAWKHTLRSQPGDSPRTRPCRPFDEFLAWLKMRSIEGAKPAWGYRRGNSIRLVTKDTGRGAY
jgi:hypothetical protein